MVEGQQAVEQANVRTYWETGRLIKEHAQLFKERADHGARTIQPASFPLSAVLSAVQARTGGVEL